MSRKKILVPVDLNRNSAELLAYAGNVAKSIQGRISCVSVLPDFPNNTSNTEEVQHRRDLELKLAQATTEVFTHEKPEFDIIVTKGNFASRILNMIKELEIDLMIIEASSYHFIKNLLSEMSVPVIVMQGQPLGLKELVLPIDLEGAYYHRMYDSIGIATLLNSNLKIMSFAPKSVDEYKYKEKIHDIKAIVEKENVACTLRFHRYEESFSSSLQDCFSEETNESILLTSAEFESFMEDNKGRTSNYNLSITLIPVRKNNRLITLTKEYCHN